MSKSETLTKIQPPKFKQTTNFGMGQKPLDKAVDSYQKSNMTITFANDFLNQPNQAYIALSGDPKIMREKLLEIAKEIAKYGKPMQGTSLHFGGCCQVSTPIWNGQKY